MKTSRSLASATSEDTGSRGNSCVFEGCNSASTSAAGKVDSDWLVSSPKPDEAIWFPLPRIACAMNKFKDVIEKKKRGGGV